MPVRLGLCVRGAARRTLLHYGERHEAVWAVMRNAGGAPRSWPALGSALMLFGEYEDYCICERFVTRLYVNQPSPVMKNCGFAVAASRMTPRPSLNG